MQGDVLLFNTPDGGEINIKNGIVELTGGFETAVYLALFGGDNRDDTTIDNKFNWWGNVVEPDPVFHYRSITQYNLLNLLPISSNLVTLENGVVSDLQRFIDIKAFDSVNVDVSFVGLRKIKIVIDIAANGENIKLEYLENWKAQEKEAKNK